MGRFHLEQDDCDLTKQLGEQASPAIHVSPLIMK